MATTDTVKIKFLPDPASFATATINAVSELGYTYTVTVDPENSINYVEGNHVNIFNFTLSSTRNITATSNAKIKYKNTCCDYKCYDVDDGSIVEAGASDDVKFILGLYNVDEKAYATFTVDVTST